MQSRNRVFDDLARMAGGAANMLGGLREEVEGLVRQTLERMLAGMDLVSRDEFDAIREVATTARAEQEQLAHRVAELEAQLQAARKPAAKMSAPKTRRRTASKAKT